MKKKEAGNCPLLEFLHLQKEKWATFCSSAWLCSCQETLGLKTEQFWLVKTYHTTSNGQSEWVNFSIFYAENFFVPKTISGRMLKGKQSIVLSMKVEYEKVNVSTGGCLNIPPPIQWSLGSLLNVDNNILQISMTISSLWVNT